MSGNIRRIIISGGKGLPMILKSIPAGIPVKLPRRNVSNFGRAGCTSKKYIPCLYASRNLPLKTSSNTTSCGRPKKTKCVAKLMMRIRRGARRVSILPNSVTF